MSSRMLTMPARPNAGVGPSGRRVERDKTSVGGAEQDASGAAAHAITPVGDAAVHAEGGRRSKRRKAWRKRIVTPALAPGGGIERHDFRPGGREVEHAVDDDGRAFDRAVLRGIGVAGVKRPGRLEIADVRPS